MVLYFSGTGNNEHVARRIGEGIGDEVLNLFEKIRTRDFSPLRSDRPWVVVAPTYAWRIPRILQQWLENTPLEMSREIYFVMTCGGKEGDAGRHLKEFCACAGLRYMGCARVVMPENYIAMFSTPGEEEAAMTIRRAQSVIDEIITRINGGDELSQSAVTLGDKLLSGIVNDLFYPLFVRAKKFYATDRCIRCGKCAQVCPLNNVRVENAAPVWSNSCTHCMACISLCPVEAVEYGKRSVGKRRYYFPGER